MRAFSSILSFLAIAADPAEIAAADAIAKAGDATTAAENEQAGTPAVEAVAKTVHGACAVGDAAGDISGTCSKIPGSIKAHENAITDLLSCATKVKELCDDKASYISFHAGEDGYHNGDGICEWFSTCSCYDNDQTCASGSKADGSALDAPKMTGKISDVLSNHANGVEPVGEVKVEGLQEDPAYIKSMQDNMLKEDEAPDEMALNTIPSAAEEEMDDAEKKEKESEDVGETQHHCPNDRETAVFRKEWQCIMRGGFEMSYFASIVAGCVSFAGLVAFMLAKAGKKKRALLAGVDGTAAAADSD